MYPRRREMRWARLLAGDVQTRLSLSSPGPYGVSYYLSSMHLVPVVVPCMKLPPVITKFLASENMVPS
jgi:hypothetical protein